jgi:hypothetical protein
MRAHAHSLCLQVEGKLCSGDGSIQEASLPLPLSVFLSPSLSPESPRRPKLQFSLSLTGGEMEGEKAGETEGRERNTPGNQGQTERVKCTPAQNL